MKTNKKKKKKRGYPDFEIFTASSRFNILGGKCDMLTCCYVFSVAGFSKPPITKTRLYNFDPI